MSEGHPSLPDREDDRTEYVQRFEDMLSRNDHYFFDVEEFELIIEHYLDNNDLKKARQVLDYARQQHPGSVDLLFCEAQVLMGPGQIERCARRAGQHPEAGAVQRGRSPAQGEHP
ncbi:MAG: hypothetical protein IPG69_04795 [Flavobacteriales bacterium]|nr:hypothetical protein [Flavobacteriales bacterium]